MKYNSGRKYNTRNQEYWFCYNTNTFRFYIEIYEQVNARESAYNIAALLYVLDSSKTVDDFNNIVALIKESENYKLNESVKNEAIYKITDSYKASDLSSLRTLIAQYDKFSANDRTPVTAVSDFVIGKVDGLDNAYDWITPFNLKVDWVNSSIQVAPQTESSYIEMPGVDGSLVEYTVYKNRMFSIMAYSQQGMTVYEKEMLKKEIGRILDSTKNETKKLTFQSPSISFDAKYSGAADISEGPSFVRATIPLETSPYGYPLFDNETYGSGLIKNGGCADVGCVHKISSGAVNPSFTLGEIKYTWNGTVSSGYTLVINHEDYSCYLEDANGNKTNALTKLTGEFQKIPKESSVALTAHGNTGNYLLTTIKERYIW